MLVPTAPPPFVLPSLDYVSGLNAHYQVANLVGVPPAEFRARIEAFTALDDATMEDYQSGEHQRGRSVRFEWSEDHDFGDFEVKGMAQNRATWLISMFIDQLKALPRDLSGKRVLDIGCWTGGTSLILAQMGASVVAIEEVRKYVDCLEYLRDSFGVSNLEPRNLSLYDLTGDEFQDAFDIVLFGGVLYHLSDPVLGARITFDALRDQGICLLETAVGAIGQADPGVRRQGQARPRLCGELVLPCAQRRPHDHGRGRLPRHPESHSAADCDSSRPDARCRDKGDPGRHAASRTLRPRHQVTRYPPGADLWPPTRTVHPPPSDIEG